MNTLSYIIYFAEISQSLKIALFIYTILFILLRLMQSVFHEEIITKGISSILFAVAVWIFIPSENAIYAMAASEYGEEVLKSPTATKAAKAIDSWIDSQIK